MTRLFPAGRLLLALCALASASALAQGVPATVAFTGNLTNSSGPATGNHPFVFTLYDKATAGSSVWTETQGAVPVTNGLVFASLGAVTPFTGLILNGAPLWLEVSVDGSVLSPRLAIQSVPYAVRAGVANSCESLGALLPNQVVAASGDQTIAGTKTFSSPIAGSITGNAATATTATTAASFSGALAGDVTGNQATTKVGKLQGVAVAATAPVAGNALVYNGTSWAPAALPGIKSSGRGGGKTVTTSPTYALLQSLDVTFPAAGQALITGECEFSAQTANTYMLCNITESVGDTTSAVFDWDPGDVDTPSTWYDQHQSYPWTKAVTAGLHTYQLNCYSNTGTQNAVACQIVAQYFPTLLP